MLTIYCDVDELKDLMSLNSDDVSRKIAELEEVLSEEKHTAALYEIEIDNMRENAAALREKLSQSVGNTSKLEIENADLRAINRRLSEELEQLRTKETTKIAELFPSTEDFQQMEKIVHAVSYSDKDETASLIAGLMRIPYQDARDIVDCGW